MPKSEFTTWFANTSLKEFAPDLAVIQVPNRFIADWIFEKYLLEIEQTFKRIVKQSPRVRFSYGQPVSAESQDSDFATHRSDLPHRPNLDPSTTFENLVTGPFNAFAFTSALEVAQRPSSQYNPLYIYSVSSLGKTHLLHAIGNYVVANRPLFRLKYLSAEAFTSDFSYSIRKERIHEFREDYRNLDLLLFDDVHLLADRKKTQDEFLFLFNILHESNKQIVLTSNGAPNQLSGIDSKLISRLGWGLITQIEPPDQESKICILKKRAEQDNTSIPEDVVFFLANSSKDVKSLVRNLVRLETYASLNHGHISMSMAMSLLKNSVDIDVEHVKKVTAGYFNISVTDLVSNNKKRAFSYPRQLAMYLARKYTRLSLKEIGHAFGHKDHSTVIYATRRIETSKDADTNMEADLRNVENLLT
ncbi:MAG: chromosomal replication initiator protein DnaA [Deltaproteobacteria bacterium]|nr:chromosomal replication initiator protein DnaA [Deltaproteobacteria bacterium]